MEHLGSCVSTDTTPPHGAPTPELKHLIRLMVQAHYEDFLDIPLPALGGRTPREAAEEPTQREAVDTLLREHEFNVADQQGVGLVDFGAMRNELGLEP